jgi:hypothetical protein
MSGGRSLRQTRIVEIGKAFGKRLVRDPVHWPGNGLLPLIKALAQPPVMQSA